MAGKIREIMATILKQAEDLMYENKRKESHGRSNHLGRA